MRATLSAALSRLTPRQRQWLTFALLAGGLFGLLYVVFLLTDPATGAGARRAAAGLPAAVTNIMTPGQQVDARDRWVGEAGKKLAQYEADKAAQEQLNQAVMSRFEQLEQRLAEKAGAAVSLEPPSPPPAPLPPGTYPPQSALPPAPPAPRESASSAAAEPRAALAAPPAIGLVRVAVAPAGRGPTPAQGASPPPVAPAGARGRDANSYLPVSFMPVTILGGVDAPTGGQAQANPQPVLLRVDDAAFLPNRYRAQVKECFVVAAAYGDIAAERAYMRSEVLSCVRHDGTTLEAKIQGSVFGEDGKHGVRGRLVEKQGQLLARALLAGIASGIGSAFASQSTTVAISPLGTTSTVESGKALEHGVAVGVGRALDRLAQYYIRMAETIFPVIEVDSGRRVDLVLTKGVEIDAPVNGPSLRFGDDDEEEAPHDPRD